MNVSAMLGNGINFESTFLNARDKKIGKHQNILFNNAEALTYYTVNRFYNVIIMLVDYEACMRIWIVMYFPLSDLWKNTLIWQGSFSFVWIQGHTHFEGLSWVTLLNFVSIAILAFLHFWVQGRLIINNSYFYMPIL